MIQMAVVPPKLYQWARAGGLTLNDRNYLVHFAMRAAFGDAAPQPFAVLESQGAPRLTVLGYGTADTTTLADNLAAFAQPLLTEAIPSASLAEKEMPSAWEKGQRLGFRVCCLPVVRKSRGPEKDAFLAACDRHGKDANLDRATVYLDWLAEHLGRDNAAHMETASMRSFNLVQPVRHKGKNAKPTRMGTRPEVVVEGTLAVDTPEAFTALLTRGVGRHRAFGYGMLLLSSPGR
jgi:CRISPR system Cascade subunit CasE